MNYNLTIKNNFANLIILWIQINKKIINNDLKLLKKNINYNFYILLILYLFLNYYR